MKEIFAVAERVIGEGEFGEWEFEVVSIIHGATEIGSMKTGGSDGSGESTERV
jgi:hypothetical protein